MQERQYSERALAIQKQRQERQRERNRSIREQKKRHCAKIVPTQVSVYSEKKGKMVVRNVNIITQPTIRRILHVG
jgi:hypothetical protein